MIIKISLGLKIQRQLLIFKWPQPVPIESRAANFW